MRVQLRARRATAATASCTATLSTAQQCTRQAATAAGVHHLCHPHGSAARAAEPTKLRAARRAEGTAARRLVRLRAPALRTTVQPPQPDRHDLLQPCPAPTAVGSGCVDELPEEPLFVPGGTLGRADWEDGVLLRAGPDATWVIGATAVLHGLRRCRVLNGTKVRVLGHADGDDKVQVADTTRPDGCVWRVHVRHLQLRRVPGQVCYTASWRDARAWAGEVQWLSPDEFGTANARAAADLLHDLGKEVFPGQEHTRGVAVDASFYPRIRPRDNLADTARGNDWVPETYAALRTKPMPWQCHPPTTTAVPQLPAKLWQPGAPLPFPQDLCRAARGDETATPFERVVEWCDAYDIEWTKFLRGQQPGKRTHRFDYDKLPGGRRGLLIEDYCKPLYAGIQWDHRPYWESGGTLPCVPFTDEHPQRHTEWNLAVMAADAVAMGYPDENLIYELTQIGFRSFSTAVDDNCVMLFPNRVGFFKDKAALDFVREKCEEERHGFIVPKLYGASKYPQLLCCRLHPRNVCVQRLPYDIEHDDGTTEPAFKRRQTVDCGVAVEDDEHRPRACRGGDATSRWGSRLSERASTHTDQALGLLSFNDAIPSDDETLHPPLHYANIKSFAAGLAVLKASDMKVGLFCKDARAYYRYLVTNSREVHCSLMWVDNQVKCELDSNLQFGMKTNCSASTRTSTFLLERIRLELRREQQRWRDDGLLAGLTPDDQAKLQCWEEERRAACTAELHELQAQWRREPAGVRVESGPTQLHGDYDPCVLDGAAAYRCATTQATICWATAENCWRLQSDDGAVVFLGPPGANKAAPWDAQGDMHAAQWTAQRLHGTSCTLHGAACGLSFTTTPASDATVARWTQEREAEVERTLVPWWCEGCFIDDFFGGAFHWFLPTMIRIFDEVFARFNITMADGRIDPVTGAVSKNKFEQSMVALTVLGIEIEVASKYGHLRLADERAELYAAAAEAMVGRRYVPKTEFESLAGRVTFAAQALPKLRGLMSGLLGVMRQGWSTRDHVALCPAAWAMLASAAATLRENAGCVLQPMQQAPGAADRPVTWVFTDAARDPEAKPDKYVGYGCWVWPEGSDTVFMANGQWAPCEQELDITSLEMFTANLGLELAQWVQVELAGPDPDARAAAADSALDVVLVGDNMGAMLVSQSVRATSPSLRALVAQRAERTNKRRHQRTFATHCFREEGEEADDLSKDELEVLAAKLHRRFGRAMHMVMLPPPPHELRSLKPARLAAAEYAKGTKRGHDGEPREQGRRR